MKYQQIKMFVDYVPHQDYWLLIDAGEGTPKVLATSPCPEQELSHVYRIGAFMAYRSAFPDLEVYRGDIRIKDYLEEG